MHTAGHQPSGEPDSVKSGWVWPLLAVRKNVVHGHR